MGHSQQSKTETHSKIVKTAAKRLRERGIDGIGVAELMDGVGLTVGGFYKHFASREALVAEALTSIESVWRDEIATARARGVRDTKIYSELVERYLSEQHRDHPGKGCLFAALSSDVGRSGKPVRDAATQRFERGLELLGGLYGGGKVARAHALMAFSAMVGALSLSRMVNDDALSKELLDTVAETLKKKPLAP